MAITVNDAFKKAALDGAAAVFNSGFIRLQATGPTTLASLGFGATAFAAASTASPSAAVSNAITAATSPTAGTITLFRLETSGSGLRLNGSVGVGSGDWQVTDNVIPSGTTSVTCAGGITLTLQITG